VRDSFFGQNADIEGVLRRRVGAEATRGAFAASAAAATLSPSMGGWSAGVRHVTELSIEECKHSGVITWELRQSARGAEGRP
jgi:hypothetical protein